MNVKEVFFVFLAVLLLFSSGNGLVTYIPLSDFWQSVDLFAKSKATEGSARKQKKIEVSESLLLNFLYN